MAILGIQTVENKDFQLSDFSPNGKGKLRTATRKDGDAASFSSDALSRLKDATGGSGEGMFGSVAKAKLNGKEISYNNATGVLKFGGTTLNLGAKAGGEVVAGKKDDIAIGETSDGIVVKNKTTGKNYIFGSDGKPVMEEVQDPANPSDPTKKIKQPKVPTNTTFTDALTLNRSGSSVTGEGSTSNVIINTVAGASISGGAAASNDKIFNFSAKAAGITGGGGKDAVYSVGLNAGANITVGSGNLDADMSYVKLLGNMKGGSVTMNGNTNMLDAAGKSLTDVNVTSNDADANKTTTSAVVASALNGTNGKINVSNDNAAIDLNRLNKGEITMGSGNNSLTVNSVVGDDSTKARITTSGVDTLNIKSINKASINQAGNKSSWMKLATSIANSDMKLGKGDNSIDASRANFNKTNIVQEAGGTGSTSISGKSFMGDKDSKNNISLNGDGNSVSFSGTVSNANITMGTGSNTLDAGSIKSSIIKAGTEATRSTNSQTVTVKGGVSDTTYTGSDGDDALKFGGGVSNSNFDLGGGNNSLIASKETKTGGHVDQNLTNVNISSASNAGTQTIIAKSLSTKKKAGVQGSSSITLSGESNVSLSGSLGKNTSLTLGSLANTVHLGSVVGGKNTDVARISMGGSSGTSISSHSQTLNVKGGMSRVNLDMGGTGDISINMGGNLANSNVKLGNGDIDITLMKTGIKKNTYKNISNTSITTGSNASTTLKAGGFSGSTQVSASLTLGGGDNNVSFAGSIGGSNVTINLGSGSNTLDAKSISGGKNSRVNINVASASSQNTSSTTTMNVHGAAKNMNYNGNVNADKLTFKGAVTNALIDVDEGENSLEAKRTLRNGTTQGQTLNNVTVNGASASGSNESSMTMNVGALKNKSALNLAGDNTVTLGSVAAGTTIDMGVGSNTLTISKGIAGTNSKKVTIQFNGTNGTTNAQNVTINGNVTGLNYVGSRGDDNLTIHGKVARSNIDMKAGTDNLAIINAKTSVGMSVSDTTIKATGASNVTAGNVSSTRGKSNTFELGHGSVSLGNITGNTTITMGTGSSSVHVGTFTGSKLKFTSAGDGTFSAANIGGKAVLDYSAVTGGSVDVLTRGKGGIGEATMNFGTTSVAIIAGSTVGSTATAGSANMTNTTVNASNATSVDVVAKEIIGDSDLNMGGSSSITAENVGGGTSIVAGTGSFTMDVNTINGASATRSVSIDLGNLTSAETAMINVIKDATNFNIAGGNSDGTIEVNLGSVNQAKKSTAAAASFTATNASTITTTIYGDAKNLTYTGSDTGDDEMVLGGDTKNSKIELGGGVNSVTGTGGAGSYTGNVTNTNISDKAGATTTMTLGTYESSGGAGGVISMNGNTADVKVSGAASANISMNAQSNTLTMHGAGKGVSASKPMEITYGSNGGTGDTLTMYGSATNVKVNSKKDLDAKLLGNLENVSVNMESSDHNKLTLGSTNASTVKNLEVSMGGSGTQSSASNTLTVGVGLSVDSTKDKGLKVTMNGGTTSGTNTISGAGATLSNTIITNKAGTFAGTLGGLTNSTVNQDAGSQMNFTVKNSSKVTISAGAGSSVTFGQTGVGSKAADITVAGKGATDLKILGEAMENINVTDSGNANITVGDSATTSLKNLTAKTGNSGDVTLSATASENVDVQNGRNLTINITTAGGTFSANVKGSVTGTDLTLGNDISITAGTTIDLGKTDNSTVFKKLNVTGGTGDTDVKAASIDAGSMTLKAGANTIDVAGVLKDFVIDNKGAANTTVTAGGMSGGEIRASGGTLSITATNITGGISTFTGGKNTINVSGTMKDHMLGNSGTADTTVTVNTVSGGKMINSGSGATLAINGTNASSVAFDGGDGKMNLTVTNVTGGTIVGGKGTGSNLTIENLSDSGKVNVYTGKNAVKNVKSGTSVTAEFGAKGGTGNLLTVENNSGAISVTGGNLHLKTNQAAGTVNATDTKSSIFTIAGGTINLNGTSDLNLATITGGKIDFKGANGTSALTNFGSAAGATIGGSLYNINGVSGGTNAITSPAASTVSGGDYGTSGDSV